MRTVSHFEILRKLGSGGMGEVYLARDTKLKREVALKFLPEALRGDPERLRRFRTEAEAAAKLNHPNIATIHSIEEFVADGAEVTFIAMEYVDGETLGARIGKTGLKLDAFFDFFLPLTDALAHAHEMGRVHRDLKPANIMIRKDGTPKILDFGLARINSSRKPSEDSEAPTEVNDPRPADAAPPSLTQAGALVGTPAYMSPEQIEGRALDARTDVFSLGVVMYEALTGERPFKGSTVESIIARILEVEPEPITTLRPVTPQALWSRIRRCLKKDRDLRLPTASILHDELRDLRGEIEVAPVVVTSSLSVWRAVVLAAVVALAAGALVSRALQSAPSAPPVRKWEIALPPTGQTFGDGVASVAPDGRKLVYTQRNTLWIRDLAQLEPRELGGTEDALYAFWSPGSDAIGYFNETGLHTVSVDGGPSLHISDMTLTRFGGGGGVWRTDDTILISNGARSGIAAVSLHGGASQTFAEPGDGVRDFHSPTAFPDGRGVLVAAHMEASSTTDEIMLLTEQGHVSVMRHPGEWLHGPVYAPSGHLVYERGGLGAAEIWAVPFSLDELSAVGNPFRVADRGNTPSVSDDGTLVYVRGGDLKRLVWVDLQGRVMDTIGQPQNSLSNPSLAPDGLRVAAISNEGASLDLWLHDTVRDTKVRLTNDLGLESEPTWSSDGQRVLFAKSGAILAIANDTSGAVRELARGSNPSSSRDGRFLVYQVLNPESQRDLWYLRVSEESPDPVAWLSSPYNEGAPQFSPDGGHVVYVSDQSGRAEVYVTDFPAQQNRELVSTSGGAHPRFSPRGDALFYLEGSRLMRVPVSTGAELQVGEPEPLFSDEESGVTLASVRGTFDSPPYDVHPDGDRFVMIQAADEAVIVVVENWFREFSEAQSN